MLKQILNQDPNEPFPYVILYHLMISSESLDLIVALFIICSCLSLLVHKNGHFGFCGNWLLCSPM